MARNGSGNYTKVNTFTAGTPITAASHNQNWDDVAAEITNSVAADGQTIMTGPLKASSGTATAPGIAFGSDADSGIYRIGSNNLGVAVGGAKVLDVSSVGLTITGTLDATEVTSGGDQLIPAGIIWPFAGTIQPTGFLFCAGQEISRTTYAALFTAIGTTYGAGDASTTFNLPDLRGRVVAGQDDMGGTSANRLTGLTGGVDGDTLGGSGGAESHTLTALQIPQLATTGITASTSTSSVVSGGTVGGVDVGGFQAGATGAPFQGVSIAVTSTSTTTIGGTINATGGAAHNNVQPTLILNYIIKT